MYKIKSFILLNIAILLMAMFNYAGANTNKFPTLTLENNVLVLQLTPKIGGRIHHLSLKKNANFIKTGKPFKQGILPEISAVADNIGYLGHTVWVGPQSQWWQQQQVNLARRAENAQWPPDPFTIFATNTVIKQNNNHIKLQGVNSPITGLRLDKEISLNPINTNKIDLKTTATNITNAKVAWDLWFNTRVHGNTYIIAPVKNANAVKVVSFEQDNVGAINVNFIKKEDNNYLVEFDVNNLSRDKLSNQGKLFIQPNQGWLAGFNQGQLFIIKFPWQPKENIHPEHGQIEIYANYQPQKLDQSLIEMEFHGPYKSLQPTQSMSVNANWYLFPYPKNFNKHQKLEFLQHQLTLMDERSK
ncbi:MAG: DUF4380 domain-containing protein [Colwellia sp.]